MSFIGKFRDLHGTRIGEFYVQSLAVSARNSAGHPRWRLICGRCGYPTSIDHYRLMPLVESKHSQATLRCANPACELSTHAHHSESLSDIRRRERQANEQAARSAEEAQKSAQEQAAKERAKDARIAALKVEYRFYWNHQIQIIEEYKIASLARWCELPDTTRSKLLEIVRKDATARIEGLQEEK
jgi:hypothetical protein